MSDDYMMEIMAVNITHVIHAHARVDAIYLYGSIGSEDNTATLKP